jgi:hypothetical protein
MEAIALAGVGGSAILSFILRVREDGWLKTLLFESQMKFIIPWALVVLEVVLEFNIFVCYTDVSQMV